MALTPTSLRNYANANLPNNNSGQISAQDVRDAILIAADVMDTTYPDGSAQGFATQAQIYSQAAQSALNTFTANFSDSPSLDPTWVKIGKLLIQFGYGGGTGATGITVTFPIAFSQTAKFIPIAVTGGPEFCTTVSTTRFNSLVQGWDNYGTQKNLLFNWVALGF